MNRFSKVTGIAESPKSVVWGKSVGTKAVAAGSFAALLLVSSITVGCSKSADNSTGSSKQTSQIPLTPPQTVASNASSSSSAQDLSKPVTSRVQHKRPVTKSFAEKTYGVSFDYPRKFELEAGDKASDLLASGPMKSVRTSGTTVAAVEMPESAFPDTDFAGAFFGVSVNKDLSVEQCTGSPVQTETGKIEGMKTEEVKAGEANTEVVDQSKPLINTELHATENVSGEGPRQDDVKYFRTYQNGACYEFALNVTTVGNDDASLKHVNRDRVFDKLEKILATVKIAPTVAEPTPTAQTTASLPSTPTEAPAQK